MTAAEIANHLGVDTETIDGWIEDGLPCTGSEGKRRFDPDDVRGWLIARGLVRQQNLVPSLQALANHFGVSRRQVSKWRNQMGMPGKDGAFDLDEIAAWREARVGVAVEHEDAEDRSYWETRKVRAAAELTEKKLAEMTGRLIDVDGPKRVLVQVVHAIRTHIEQFPDRLVEVLELDADAKREVKRKGMVLVAETLRSIQGHLLSARQDNMASENERNQS